MERLCMLNTATMSTLTMYNDFFKGAFGPFKVIQGHWFWYESKVRMRRPINSSWSYVALFTYIAGFCAYGSNPIPP